MADIKITAYPELAATPDDADILEIVDDVAGTPTSKKITVANLKAAAPGDVTAAANITTNTVVVGDGGAKGVKSATAQVIIPTINLTGGQVAFPATAAPSADANTIDDYEEGTFTTTLVCGTSGTITLNTDHDLLGYTKIGNLVYIQGRIIASAINAPIGSLRLGLPFTGTVSSENSDLYGGSGVSYYDINAIGSGGGLVISQITNNVAYAPIVELTTTIWADDVANHIKATSQLVFGFHFIAA